MVHRMGLPRLHLPGEQIHNTGGNQAFASRSFACALGLGKWDCHFYRSHQTLVKVQGGQSIIEKEL